MLATSAIAQGKLPLKIFAGFPASGSINVLVHVVANTMSDDFASIAVDNKIDEKVEN